MANPTKHKLSGKVGKNSSNTTISPIKKLENVISGRFVEKDSGNIKKVRRKFPGSKINARLSQTVPGGKAEVPVKKPVSGGRAKVPSASSVKKPVLIDSKVNPIVSFFVENNNKLKINYSMISDKLELVKTIDKILSRLNDDLKLRQVFSEGWLKLVKDECTKCIIEDNKKNIIQIIEEINSIRRLNEQRRE